MFPLCLSVSLIFGLELVSLILPEDIVRCVSAVGYLELLTKSIKIVDQQKL